jgi:hypothetical protein
MNLERFEKKDKFSKYTSFGIIPIVIIDNIPYFVLIQRKESITFVLFTKNKLKKIKGNIEDEIKKMTKEEKKYLLDLYEWYKMKKIKSPLIENIELYKSCLEYTESGTLDWFFPKGRKSANHEPGYIAAMREFYEETNFSKCIKKIYIDKQITCYKQGTDRRKYYFVLYPALLEFNRTSFPNIDKRIIPVNSNEVSNIGLFTMDELKEKIEEVIPNLYCDIINNYHEIMS